MRQSLYTLFLLASCFALTSSHEQSLIVFSEPIDAMSFTLRNAEDTVGVQYKSQFSWTTPQFLAVNFDSNPQETESDLVIFPTAITKVRVRNKHNIQDWTTITADTTATSYEVAALEAMGTPRILSRRQWGADETFTVRTTQTVGADDSTRGEGGSSLREQECKAAQAAYPEDFATVRTTTTNAAGQPLLWPHRYSSNVKAVVLHHTAATYSTDARSGWEKMRMLYTYHARSKGWGDIGYHYIIDGSGQIYEGKAGGEGVVGGHAYCNNVNTIGVALMGNFNEEQPTAAQTTSLQWLLLDLGRKYNIQYDRKVRFQGELIDTLVGHEDLLATQCPGEALSVALPQIRRNVVAKSYRSSVRYPNVGFAHNHDLTPQVAPTTFTAGRSAVQVLGSTEYSNRPGASVNIQLRVSAWSQPISLRQSVATVTRSDSKIGVWQYYANGQAVRIRDKVLATKNLLAGQSVTIPLRVQLPRTAGTYQLTIGSSTIRLIAEGRRTPVLTNTRAPSTSTSTVSQRGRATVQTIGPTTRRPVFYRSADATTTNASGENIRIKLSYDANTAEIDVGNAGTLDGKSIRGTVKFSKSDDRCIATAGLVRSTEASPRVSAELDELTITSWDTSLNKFRGTIECQIEAGKLILINDLPLEKYMWGLAEEPDTEPYQKQRAFAVAARSYAAHYMEPQYRKFPGKQYDGSDSPAEFQKYGGIVFERNHPRWVEAVKDTSNLVLKKNNQVVKAPYFSSNDGRTRSPAENGWANFLFAEIFYAKPDPWCQGMTARGHGVGMSGCGAKGQALEGKTGEQILEYYYPSTIIAPL